MFAGSSESSLLRTAVLAVSELSLYRYSKAPELYHIARASYGRALGLANEVLALPDTVTSDETLCSILLLYLFEDIVGERVPISNNHFVGLQQLVQIRQNQQFDMLYGWIATQLTYTKSPELVCSIIHKTIYIEPSDVPRSDDLNNPIYSFTILGALVCKFCVKASTVHSSILAKLNPEDPSLYPGDDMNELVSLLEEVDALERSARVVLEVLPQWLEPSSSKPSACGTRTILIYSSRWVACFWMLIYLINASFYQRVIECSDLLAFLQLNRSAPLRL
ncbi:hypothetical protein TWF481_003655 [Arthrobotrys musiformis]|uniref:Uncharacterized protein n=1 Tax=Arthrobotrys musiformis TaxID=47236 RepID=A0AAV9WMX9_9PEZI